MAPTPKRTYPTPPTIDTMPGHLQNRPACHALWAAGRAQALALAEANSERPHWGRAATYAQGARDLLRALRHVAALDTDPGQLGAIAAGMGFAWDDDEEEFLAPLLTGIR
jgi:hypothetical protein